MVFHHFILLLKEANWIFKCEVCDYSCSQKGDLKKHVISVHEGKKPFKCEVCDYSCAKNSIMKRPMT